MGIYFRDIQGFFFIKKSVIVFKNIFFEIFLYSCLYFVFWIQNFINRKYFSYPTISTKTYIFPNYRTIVYTFSHFYIVYIIQDFEFLDQHWNGQFKLVFCWVHEIRLRSRFCPVRNEEHYIYKFLGIIYPIHYIFQKTMYIYIYLKLVMYYRIFYIIYIQHVYFTRECPSNH